MAVIRERSPSEINIEKKLTNFQGDFEDTVERTGNLYGFFRKQAKEVINYHLDKTKKPKKQKLGQERRQKSVAEDISPIKNITLKKKKGKIIRKSEGEEIVEDNEYSKIKEILKRRRYVIESAITSLQSQMKPLSTIKVTTNREHLVQQVCEVENTNQKIMSDLEAQLLSLHDAMRQIEKLGQISSHETKILKLEMTENYEIEMKKDREKYERQLEALKESNANFAKLPKVTDVEHEFKKRIKELENQIEQKNLILDEKTENMIKKSSEVGNLQVNLHRKQQEIEKLNKELENMQKMLDSQQSEYENQLNDTSSGMQNLNEKLKVLSKELENSRNSAGEKVASVEQAKDREISRLQKELANADEEYRERLKTYRLEDESKNREIRDLKVEIQRIQDQQENLLLSGDQEVYMLRKALEDKEKQLASERERMLIEIENKEKYRIKQKNEWAEIYTGLKHEIKDLKERISQITLENDNLAGKMDRSHNENVDGQLTLKSQVETFKQKIREKEQELKNLWEVVAELQRTHQTKGKIDFNDVRTLIVIKNLEEKARQRIRL